MNDEPTNLNPGAILSRSNAYWESCALHAAVKLELFDRIGAQPCSARTLSLELDCDERRLRTLLDAMVAMKLLDKKDELFENTLASTTFLTQDSPRYVGFIIKHHHHLVDSWRRLDESILSGEPVRDRSSRGDETVREAFLMGMFNSASQLAPQWAEEIDLDGSRRLLDLGGGPGTWAIYFCRANPKLRATVFDLPTSQPFAEKTIERFNLSDRIDFCGGDYHEDTLGDARFDVVWISHILHSDGPEACRALLEKALLALKPGGRVMIHDFILDDDLAGPLFPALFSLNMAVGTEEGRAYSTKQIAKLLEQTGAVDIERLPLTAPNGSAIVVGRKPK